MEWEYPRAAECEPPAQLLGALRGDAAVAAAAAAAAAAATASAAATAVAATVATAVARVAVARRMLQRRLLLLLLGGGIAERFQRSQLLLELLVCIGYARRKGQRERRREVAAMCACVCGVVWL